MRRAVYPRAGRSRFEAIRRSCRLHLTPPGHVPPSRRVDQCRELPPLGAPRSSAAAGAYPAQNSIGIAPAASLPRRPVPGSPLAASFSACAGSLPASASAAALVDRVTSSPASGELRRIRRRSSLVLVSSYPLPLEPASRTIWPALSPIRAADEGFGLRSYVRGRAARPNAASSPLPTRLKPHQHVSSCRRMMAGDQEFAGPAIHPAAPVADPRARLHAFADAPGTRISGRCADTECRDPRDVRASPRFGRRLCGRPRGVPRSGAPLSKDAERGCPPARDSYGELPASPAMRRGRENADQLGCGKRAMAGP